MGRFPLYGHTSLNVHEQTSVQSQSSLSNAALKQSSQKVEDVFASQKQKAGSQDSGSCKVTVTEITLTDEKAKAALLRWIQSKL